MKYVTSREFKSLAQSAIPKGIGIRKEYDTAVEVMPDRCVKFTISSDAVDRVHDRIMQDGWELDGYHKNPVVLWGHNDGEPPIGKCVSIGIEDGKLKAIVQFMPETIPVYGPKAEAIYRMCCDGFLNATSVGFKVKAFELTKDPERGANDWEPGMDVLKAELVEFSIVSVPCNPEALIEATPQAVEPQEPEAKDEPDTNAEKALSINTGSNITRHRMKMWEFYSTL